VTVFRRVGVLVLAVLLTQVPAAAIADDPLQPDLGMARLANLKVKVTDEGRRQLRFSTTIVNVGRGTFELTANRPSPSEPFTVTQWLTHPDRSRTGVPVSAGLVWGGDGHDHWHVKDLETYQLMPLGSGDAVSTGKKGGYCFYDNVNYLNLGGSSRVYEESGCGMLDTLAVSMGLSYGWGDKYSWELPGQDIDITGLPDGQYRLLATADAHGMFVESNHSNNSTWIDIDLEGLAVTILGYGPTA
jgi:hypothetical protein